MSLVKMGYMAATNLVGGVIYATRVRKLFSHPTQPLTLLNILDPGKMVPLQVRHLGL